MLLQLLVALACLVAGVFQLLATVPHIGERLILRAARRITAVSMLLASVYIVYCVFWAFGADPVHCWVLGLFSLGQLLFSMNTFMDPQRTEELLTRTRKALNETSHA